MAKAGALYEQDFFLWTKEQAAALRAGTGSSIPLSSSGESCANQIPSIKMAAAAAEGHFRQVLDRARRQGALSWELRAATSLARLLRDQGRSANAIACL